MKKRAEAIVLAGGKGSRLAPLTEDTPKPMLKIMGKTVLENVFDRIADAGVTRAYVSTMYLPWQVESLGTSRKGVKINYVREKEPLGTAGGAANAYDGDADAVIVLSGDGLYDFDLKKIIDSHFEKNADVTIVTYPTDDPLDFGVVLYGEDGRVTRFEEKPPWAKVVSGTVNTGIYVISREILDSIPKNGEYDFAKQLFPLLLARKKRIFAYEAKGVWHDIGNLDGYFEAVRSALDGKLPDIPNDGFTAKELEKMGVEAEVPFYVSRSAVIGTNVKLGAYTVIGAEAVISDNSDIASSIISDGVKLGNGCGVYGSIIGRNTRLGENCMISEGCVIGANAVSGDSVILPKYSFIHSSERISSYEYRKRPCGKRERNLFTDDGISCDISEKSPEYIIRIGYAAACTAKDRKSHGSVRIGVMTDDNIKAEHIGKLILEGIRSCGVRSIAFGYGYEAVARFAARELITDNVIYIGRSKDGHVNAVVFDSSGFPVSDSFERSFTSAFFLNCEYTPPERFYEPDRMDNIGMLYYLHILKKAKALLPNDGLEGFVCAFGNAQSVRANSPSYTAICAITELGGSITRRVDEASVCFEIDEAGSDSMCISKSISLDSFHINAALLSSINPDKNGEKLYFSGTMPRIYREIAKSKGFETEEYATHSDTDTKSIPPTSAKKLCFLEDGVMRTLYFAILLHTSKSSLGSVYKKLPAFGIFLRSFDSSSDRALTMQKLSKMAGSGDKGTVTEGIKIKLATGSVTVIPRKASGFKLIGEAASTEAARELCDTAKEYLK